MLWVVVVNGTAVPLAIAPMPVYGQSTLPAVPATGLVSSPAAMGVAAASNASFVAAHPGLNASLALIYQVTPSQQNRSGWFWRAQFTACSPWGGTIFSANWTYCTGVVYSISINATTGTTPFSGFPGTETCLAPF